VKDLPHTKMSIDFNQLMETSAQLIREVSHLQDSTNEFRE
jgi:hypothetical protein